MPKGPGWAGCLPKGPGWAGCGGAATFLLVWQERWSWCLEKGTVQGVNRMSFSNYVEFLLNFYDTFLHARVKTMGASLYIYIYVGVCSKSESPAQQMSNDSFNQEVLMNLTLFNTHRLQLICGLVKAPSAVVWLGHYHTCHTNKGHRLLNDRR